MTTTRPAATSQGAVLSGPTLAAYAADWAAFATWCDAFHHSALPTDADTVLAYLADDPAAAATVRRRLVAIDHFHRRHGFPSPADGVRARRDAPPAAAAATAEAAASLDTALVRIPLEGWPTALYGARDALLLTLRIRGNMTFRQLVTVESDQLKIGADGSLLLHTAAGQHVDLPPTDDPKTCPGCICTRWRRWLTLLTRHSVHRLADQYRSGRLDSLAGDRHLCRSIEDGDCNVSQHAAVVFVPLDRWGHPPLPLQPLTVRTAVFLTGVHLAGDPPTHVPGHVPGPLIDLLAAGLTAAPERHAPPASARPLEEVLTAGLNARRRAVELYPALSAQLDDVEDIAEELAVRITALLAP